MNESPKKWKLILAGLMVGVLLGGTVAVTTPSFAAGTAKIWQQIKQKTDQRYYTKTQSDKRYVPKPKVIRGAMTLSSAQSGQLTWTSINFGVTLATAPVPHIIAKGDPAPFGCSGNVGNPSASPGHLCIFEDNIIGLDPRFVCTAGDDCPGTSKFGAHYGAYATNDFSQGWGSWAVGVGKISTSARLSVSGTTSGQSGPAGN